MHALKTEIIQINENEFLLININNYTINCGNISKMASCKSCIVKLPQGCELKSDTWFIQPSIKMHTHTDRETVQHTINLPLLNQFFTNDSLQFIKGSFFLDKPPLLKIPDFKYFMTNLTKNLARDDRLSIDFNKAAEQIKNDRVIVQGLSESIILGDVYVPDRFWDTIAGYVTTSIGALLILLIIAMAYFWYKIRCLTIMLLVLQQSVLKAQGNEQLVFDYFKTENSVLSKQITNTSMQLNEVLMEISGQIWAHTVIVMLSLAFLILTVMKIHKRFGKKLTDVNFELILELLGNKSHFISLFKLSGIPSDYQISMEFPIQNVTVIGSIKPTLNFDWSSLKITNILSSKTVGIPQCIGLSFRKSAEIKLEKEMDFSALFLAQNKTAITRMKILYTQEERVDFPPTFNETMNRSIYPSFV